MAAAVISAVTLRPPDRAEILRLALIAHTKSQGWRGSGSDCAAAVYGGTIAFRSFDIPYLQSAAQDNATWKLLLHDLESSVRTLPEYPFENMVPIWTGHKESTPRLLKHSESLFNSPRWQAHLEEGERIALGMANVATPEGAANYLSLGRNWFYAFNTLTGGHVVPTRMRSLLDLLTKRGVSAKPSGAGGGDCLIGMLPAEVSDETIQRLTVPLSSNAEGVLVKTGD